MVAYPAYLAAALAVVSPAMGHLFMAAPAPIPGTAPKDPLEPNGSNFPCHGVDVGSYSGSRIDMAVGSSQPLEFDLGYGANTAVHGGGSCQISITYETDPTALKDPSNWKVIHSFIDGCPTNAAGNLAIAIACNPNGGDDCTNSFDFTIPPEVRNGDAILAWTWFNNVGNREMYMNCAAVTFSGGEDKIQELPTMFVANIASVNTCASVAYEAVQFPYPGEYVTTQYSTDGTSVYPIVEPPTCAGVGAPSGGSTSGGDTTTGDDTTSSSSVASSTTSAATTSSAASTSAYVPTTMSTAVSSPANFYQTGSTTTAAATTTASTTSTSVTSTSASSTSAAATSSADYSSASSGTCPSGQVTCSGSGFYCISETSFGLCNNGCAVPQDVSQGTKCTRSEIDFVRRAAYMPPQARRSLRLF